MKRRVLGERFVLITKHFAKLRVERQWWRNQDPSVLFGTDKHDAVQQLPSSSSNRVHVVEQTELRPW